MNYNPQRNASNSRGNLEQMANDAINIDDQRAANNSKSKGVISSDFLKRTQYQKLRRQIEDRKNRKDDDQLIQIQSSNLDNKSMSSLKAIDHSRQGSQSQIQKTDLAKQLYKLAFGEPLELQTPVQEESRGAKNRNNMKYFNEIHKLRNQLQANQNQNVRAKNNSLLQQHISNSNAAKKGQRSGSKPQSPDPRSGLSSSQSQHALGTRIQKNVQFRNSSISISTNQLDPQEQLKHNPMFQKLPRIKNLNQDNLVAPQQSQNLQSQREGYQMPYRYDITSGGDDDFSYPGNQNTLKKQVNEPQIITSRGAKYDNTTNFSTLDQSKLTKYQMTRNSWQPGNSSQRRKMKSPAQKFGLTNINFDQQSKNDSNQNQFQNSQQTNRTFKVPQKFENQLQKSILTITDQKNNLTQITPFKSLETITAKKVKNGGFRGNSDNKYKQSKSQVNNRQTQSTIQQMPRDYMIKKELGSSGKKVHYADKQQPVMHGQNKNKVNKDNSNYFGGMHDPIARSSSGNLNQKFKYQPNSSQKDLKGKINSLRSIGFSNKSAVNFIQSKDYENKFKKTAKVLEESRDYSDDEAHGDSLHKSPFLTDLPNDKSIFKKNKIKLSKIEQTKKSSDLSLNLANKLNSANSLNTLNKINTKFSKEQMRILGNPSQYEGYQKSPANEANPLTANSEYNAVHKLIVSCKTIKSHTNALNSRRSINQNHKPGLEFQFDNNFDRQFNADDNIFPQGNKDRLFRRSQMNFERNSSMALITRRSENFQSSIHGSEGNKSADEIQSHNSPQMQSTAGQRLSQSLSVNHAIDIDKVNRNIEQKLVDIFQTKCKDKSKLHLNIQHVQTISEQRRNLQFQFQNISEIKKGNNKSQASHQSVHSNQSFNEYTKNQINKSRGYMFNSRDHSNQDQRYNSANRRQVKLTISPRKNSNFRPNGSVMQSSSPAKSPDLFIMEQAQDLIKTSKKKEQQENAQIDHQSYVAYVSDKLLKIYEDMQSYNITFDDLNSKNGLIQQQIKQMKYNESQHEILVDDQLPSQIMTIQKDQVSNSKNAQYCDIRSRNNFPNNKSIEVSSRSTLDQKSNISQNMTIQKSQPRKTEQEKDEKEEEKQAKDMTPEEAIASLKAFIPPPGPVNHVKQNIALSSKIHKIRDIQLFYRNYIKDQNRKDVQRFIQEIDMVQRQCSLSASAKWNVFKQKRDLLVDRYTQLKRKMLWVKFIVTIMKCHAQVLNFRELFIEKKNQRKRSGAKRLIALRGAVLWRIKLRKYGKRMLGDHFKNQIRYSLLLYANTALNSNAVIQADQKEHLTEFFKNQAWWAMLQTIKSKTHYFNQQIHFMQKRIQEKLQTLEAKVDIVRFYWEKMHIQWYQKAIETKDVGMRNILIRVAKVKPEIREFILQNYIRQCKKRYAVAFMEWRLLFSKARRENGSATQMEDVDVQEIISDREEYMINEFRSHLENLQLTNEMVKIGAYTTIKSNENYGFGQNTMAQHLVNSLPSIGWTDPFPWPLRIKSKYHEPKPNKDEIQNYKEQAKDFNQQFIGRDFLHQSFRIIPMVHIVKMRANSQKLRYEIMIQTKLAQKLHAVFTNQEKLFNDEPEAKPAETSPTKIDLQSATKIKTKKSKSRSKGKKRKSTNSPKSPKKSSKDASFDATAGNANYFDMQIDAESQESSLFDVLEETSPEELQQIDPVKYFRLLPYQKFITKNDREMLREAMISQQRYNLTYQIQRYNEEYSPMCVYLPTNDVLFKLMRASIGLDKVEDVWIYNKGYSGYMTNETVNQDLID